MEEEETVGSSGGALLGSPEENSSGTNKMGGGGNNHNNNNKQVDQQQQQQDKFLPIANVGRIMKKAIPGGGKISKDAKETVQECVSEFISFVTGEASDKCQREKRKTINGDDILWAITTLGFDDYVSPLKIYLNKYRELEGDRLNPHPPKQHQHQHQNQNQNALLLLDQQQQQQQHASSTHVYSTYVSSPSSDHHLQPYLNLPFPPAPAIQAPFTAQQEHIDSIAHWQ